MIIGGKISDSHFGKKKTFFTIWNNKPFRKTITIILIIAINFILEKIPVLQTIGWWLKMWWSNTKQGIETQMILKCSFTVEIQVELHTQNFSFRPWAPLSVPHLQIITIMVITIIKY